MLWQMGHGRTSGFPICHLPFPICHLPFAICHLPFAICHQDAFFSILPASLSA
jgi:hypothetical protein